MDKVKKPSNSECYTLSSEPFRIYTYLACPIISFNPVFLVYALLVKPLYYLTNVEFYLILYWV
jgi:hypothetical protein